MGRGLQTHLSKKQDSYYEEMLTGVLGAFVSLLCIELYSSVCAGGGNGIACDGWIRGGGIVANTQQSSHNGFELKNMSRIK